jgi:hypothetical protein
MRIPAGMGLVVPAERIIETIESDPNLKKRRDEVIAKEQQKSAYEVGRGGGIGTRVQAICITSSSVPRYSRAQELESQSRRKSW